MSDRNPSPNPDNLNRKSPEARLSSGGSSGRKTHGVREIAESSEREKLMKQVEDREREEIIEREEGLKQAKIQEEIRQKRQDLIVRRMDLIREHGRLSEVSVNANVLLTHFANLEVTHPERISLGRCRIFACSEAIFHAITLSVDSNHFGMVKKTIKQSRCQDFIIQEFSPFAKAGITGKNN